MALISKDISKAISLLEEGQLVAIPTETVYGLAGNALDATAVAKIFSAKNRPSFDPLIVHTSEIERAKQWVESIPDIAIELARHFWPGPLTIVLKKKSAIPDLVTAGLDTVGIRCPNHPLTLQLLKQISFPLAAPSANPFGYISPTLPTHVNEQLGDQIRFILDGGPCQIGIESTIIGFEKGLPVVYRMGGLAIEKIEKVLGKVAVRTSSTDRPLAPGQLSRHYSPGKKLMLGKISEMIKTIGGTNVGALVFSTSCQEIAPENQRVLSANQDLEEAAKNLFTALRELDKLNISVILAEEVPDLGLGRAINDRLRRAAVQEK